MAVLRLLCVVMFCLVIFTKARHVSSFSAGDKDALMTQLSLKPITNKSRGVSKNSPPLRQENTSMACTHRDNHIDCSYLKLTGVPEDTFPDTVSIYNLCCNSISSLPNFVFERYKELTILILSNNNISVLGDFSFWGLAKLKVLDLSKNALVMKPTTFPKAVFSPLISLEILSLHWNNPDGILNSTDLGYPDRALSNLSRLEQLYIDGLTSKEFGPGFQNLTRLTSLKFVGRRYEPTGCEIGSLSNTTFRHVPNLKYLTMRYCNLLGDRIEEGAFLPLKKLQYLDISYNWRIGLKYLPRIFYGLYETKTLRKLHMEHVVLWHSIGICLDSSFISYFPQHLIYLNAGKNNLEGVSRNIIGKLSPSLRVLDVGGNDFAYGTYFLDFHKMQNLTDFIYNGRDLNERPYLPPRYPHQLQRYITPNANCSLYEQQETEQYEQPFILRLPPNLRNVRMNDAGLIYVLSELTVDPNNLLENLSMEGNDFPELRGPWRGLNFLKHMKLRSSNIRKISELFFQYFVALETLDLSSNLLGNFFTTAAETPVFSNLTNLQVLNLTMNDIKSFSKDTFTGLLNMRTLLLSENPLETFDVNISHMNKLEYLDLKETRIAVLPVGVRQHFEFLLSQHVNVELNFAKSPIACNCENLDFLKWITESKVALRGGKEYECLYSDLSQKIITDRYASALETMRRECSSNVAIFILSGTLTLVALTVIIGAILYRFRWKLRYLYYAAYLRFQKDRGENDRRFEFDAFISYDTDDKRFVLDKLTSEMERRGLKLCIHERDFTAGEFIASNVVRAVCNSKKTVVVLSRAMMDSYWCGYEIQMANMESIHTGRRVLIFLLMEKIPENELGVELLYNIRNNTYIPFPDRLSNDISMGRLWDKLAADIRA